MNNDGVDFDELATGVFIRVASHRIVAEASKDWIEVAKKVIHAVDVFMQEMDKADNGASEKKRRARHKE